MTPNRSPLISVVVPAYNRASYIGAAIKSVLDQTYEHLELVVVDDGSTDATAQVIEEFAASDPRIRLLKLSANRGAQVARNAAIRVTNGSWVAFLDSDDRYLPDSLETRLTTALSSHRRIVHSDAFRLAIDGSRAPYGIPVLDGDIRKQLLRAPGPFFQALLVRREVLEAIGLLDESIVAWHEWETSIRLSAIDEFAFVGAPTFEYNEGTPGAISGATRRAANGYEQIVRKHRGAILREVGAEALGNHYRTITHLRLAGGDLRGSIKSAAVAGLIWPPHGLRAVRRIARAVAGTPG